MVGTFGRMCFCDLRMCEDQNLKLRHDTVIDALVVVMDKHSTYS